MSFEGEPLERRQAVLAPGYVRRDEVYRPTKRMQTARTMQIRQSGWKRPAGLRDHGVGQRARQRVLGEAKAKAGGLPPGMRYEIPADWGAAPELGAVACCLPADIECRACHMRQTLDEERLRVDGRKVHQAEGPHPPSYRRWNP